MSAKIWEYQALAQQDHNWAWLSWSDKYESDATKEVRFMFIVCPSFNCNGKTDIRITFDSIHIPDHVFKDNSRKRLGDHENFVLMNGAVVLPIPRIPKTGLGYRYEINGVKEEKKRFLRLPDTHRTPEIKTWYQVDFMLTKTSTQSWNVYKGELRTCMYVLLPKWYTYQEEHIKKPGNRLVEMMDCIIFSSVKQFPHKTKETAEYRFKKEFGKFIRAQLDEKSRIGYESIQHERAQWISWCLVVLMSLQRLGITLEERYTAILYGSMHIYHVVHLRGKQISSEFWHILDHFTWSCMTEFEKSLKNFIADGRKEKGDLEFIKILPLYHLIDAKVEKHRQSKRTEAENWLGMREQKGLLSKVETFAPIGKLRIGEISDKLWDFTRVDRLLARTLLHLLSPDQLEVSLRSGHLNIPLEDYIQALTDHYTDVPSGRQMSEDLEDTLVSMCHCFAAKLEGTEKSPELILRLMKVTKKLLSGVCIATKSQSSMYKTMEAAVMLVVRILNFAEGEPLTKVVTDKKMLYKLLLEFKFDWLKSSAAQPDYLIHSLNLCNNIMNLPWENTNFKNEYTDGFRTFLKDSFQEAFVSPTGKLEKKGVKRLKAFWKSLDEQAADLRTDVEDILIHCIFEVLEKGQYFMEFIKDHGKNSRRTGKLTSRIYEKWAFKSQATIIDRFSTIKWKPFVFYDEMLHMKHDLCKEWSKEIVSDIKNRNKFLFRKEQDILDNRESLANFRVIYDHKDTFLKILELWKRRASVNTDGSLPIAYKDPNRELKAVMEERYASLQKLDTIKKELTEFVRLTKNLNSEELDQLQVNLGKSHEEMTLGDIRTGDTGFYGMPKELLDIIPEFSKTRKRMIFKNIWDGITRVYLSEANISIVAIVHKIWDLSILQMKQLHEKVSSGQISLPEVDKYFHFLVTSGVGTKIIDSELSGVCDPDKCKERKAQIEMFFQMRENQKAVDILLNLRMTYKLTGDFSSIEVYTDTTSLNKVLSDIKLDQRRTLEVLTKLTDTKLHALRVFADCFPLVEWFRQNVKGQKEISTFVNILMAHQSTGQGSGDSNTEESALENADDDFEVGKIQCLLHSTAGYDRLIYDLKPETDLKQLLKLCEPVWRYLDTCPTLAHKLLETNRHREEWLEKVKKVISSVEKTTVDKIVELCEHGTFHVGNLEPDKPKSLDNTVILWVKQDGKTEELKPYDSFMLDDLQVKLMLIRGKANRAKDLIERFLDLYDSVKRLAKAYIDLCMEGSFLFENWRCKFNCNSFSDIKAFIDFDLDDKEMRSEGEEDVIEVIDSISDFLEKCLLDWRQEIFEKRSRHRYLNHFTNCQIITLSKELSKMILETEKNVDNTDMPLQSHSLLSKLYAKCSQEELIQALQDAEEEINKRKRISISEDGANDAEATGCGGEIQQLYQDLLDSGNDFTHDLIKAAIKAVGYEDRQTVVDWCFDHYYDEDLEGASNLEGEMVRSRTESVTQHLDIDYLLRDNRPVHVRLESLWKNFLHTVEVSRSDFLSLEHIGLAFAILHQDKEIKPCSISDCLSDDHPNLILCAEDDIVKSVLTLYSFCNQDDRPLPHPSDVLICTGHTTAEQVKLMLQRAVSSRGEGRIFCLAYADLLSHEVAQITEDEIDKYVRGVKGIHLVFLCCTERAFLSHIVTSMDKYKVEKFEPMSDEMVAKYLNHKFQQIDVLPADTTCMSRASVADPENMRVRLVKSHKAGGGKSNKVLRLMQRLRTHHPSAEYIRIRLHKPIVDIAEVMAELGKHRMDPLNMRARLIHIDVGQTVKVNLDTLFFNLLILGGLENEHGQVWVRGEGDYFVLEAMSANTIQPRKSEIDRENEQTFSIFRLVPSLTCWDPKRSMHLLREEAKKGEFPFDQLMDEEIFRRIEYQQPYMYLKKRSDERRKSIFHSETPFVTIEEKMANWLEIVLDSYPGQIKEPSWYEIKYFVSFLYVQFRDFEQFLSNKGVTADGDKEFPGIEKFVTQFLIEMSEDFATPSCDISEEALSSLENSMAHLSANNPKRKWEHCYRPYLFVNDGNDSMTFLGFYIDAQRNLLDCSTQNVLRQDVISKELMNKFFHQGYDFRENLQQMNRPKGLMKLCRMMGIPCDDREETDRILELSRRSAESGIWRRVNRLIYSRAAATTRSESEQAENVIGVDPDPNYELTADNVKKILSIYMKFRCGIPVVIMGETGCGKTRLIKYLCDLQRFNIISNIYSGDDTEYDLLEKARAVNKVKNLYLFKVHGGTTKQELRKAVWQASGGAVANAEFVKQYKLRSALQTVLFLDEANTTEHVGLIKEILCDGTFDGETIPESNLKFVAACNPYRRHSDDMILSLTKSGLGYHSENSGRSENFGRIPMRHLVYRVQPLPKSLLHVVCDFGALDDKTEELYIKQIVHGKIEIKKMTAELTDFKGSITATLKASQQHMREQKDECSFVSLRDIDRAMDVFIWFYENKAILFPWIKRKFQEVLGESLSQHSTDSQTSETSHIPEVDESSVLSSQKQENVAWSLILALAVCYHSCLKKRKAYREKLAPELQAICTSIKTQRDVLNVITSCQDVFLDNVHLDQNIARNHSLKENVFMMILCMQLSIPLFLVGKPGSSKSLAKTVVLDAMQGASSRSELFKFFKKITMISYQCSPLSTSRGITEVFNSCTKLQDGEDPKQFRAVAALDEIGLAEDSPHMPLKTLHPLLDYGTLEDVDGLEIQRAGFIGISNWALDPAKMNRGICVQRGTPGTNELIDTARGICDCDQGVLTLLEPVLEPMVKAYLKLYNLSCECYEEYFGYRDLYCWVKMAFSFCKTSQRSLSWAQMEHCIRRCFGGIHGFDPVAKVENLFEHLMQQENPEDELLDNSPLGLLQAGLRGGNEIEGNRYVLVVTENTAALDTVESQLKSFGKDYRIIFGSSFPRDHAFSQICRDINKIKVCMERGETIILLNLEMLYDSLYDVLNQYYVTLGGDNYVDLGLGSQKVIVKVHPEFRIIVVSEKTTVKDRSKFPTPLINRLEKHYIAMETLLSPEENSTKQNLENWMQNVCASLNSRNPSAHAHRRQLSAPDVFIGYHDDTLPSVIHCLTSTGQSTDICADAERILLRCCIPEAIVRANALASGGTGQSTGLRLTRKHDSLAEILNDTLTQNDELSLLQITTHSSLLPTVEIKQIAENLEFSPQNVMHVNLRAVPTEQKFSHDIRGFLLRTTESPKKLCVIQCAWLGENDRLVECARYKLKDELSKQEYGQLKYRMIVCVVVQLPRKAGGCFIGYQGKPWSCYHLDELNFGEFSLSTMMPYLQSPVSSLLYHLAREKTPGMLDMTRLFMKNLQQACSTLVDDQVATQRSIKRIRILQSLLTDDRAFVQILENTISLVMGKLELERSLDAFSRNWLSHFVCSPSYVQRIGTFQKAILSYVEMKTMPILSTILSCVDHYGNLDLLANCTNENGWIKEFWLQIVKEDSDELFCENPTIGHQTQHVVRSKAADGKSFTCHFPFSWHVREVVRQIIHEAKQAEFSEKFFANMNDLWQKTKIGRLIVTKFGDHTDDLMERYLHDFVRLHYHCRSQEQETEYKVMTMSIRTAALQMYLQLFPGGIQECTGGESPTFTLDIPMVHLAFSCMQSRLNHLGIGCSILPSALDGILSFQMRGEIASEVTADVHLFKLLVERLQPPDNIKDDTVKVKWLDLVEKYSVYINPLLEAATETRRGNSVYMYGKWCRQEIEKFRKRWTKIQIFAFFIKNVCPSGYPLNSQPPMLFWRMALPSDPDLKKHDQFDKMIKYLETHRSKNRDRLFRLGVPCKSCGQRMSDSPVTPHKPVTLPCDHACCVDCLTMKLKTADRNCPCRAEIPAEFVLISNLQNKEMLDQIHDYESRCDTFLLDVMTTFIFDDGPLPSPNIVQRLMGLVLDSDGYVKFRETPMKAFRTPGRQVLKSIVLQYLLKSNCQEVEQYIEIYLGYGREIIQDIECPEDKRNDFLKASLMCVICLQECRRLNPTVHGSLGTRAYTILQNAAPYLQSQQLNYKVLDAVAAVRFALHRLAHAIAVQFGAATGVGGRADNMENLKLFSSLEDLCKRFQMPKLYLVELIVKTYGMNCLLDASQTYPFLVNIGDGISMTTGRVDRFMILGEKYTEYMAMVQSVIEKAGSITETGALDERLLMLAACGSPAFSFLEEKQAGRLMRELQENIQNTQIKAICAASLTEQTQVGNHLQWLHPAASKGSIDWETKLLLLHFYSVFQSDQPNPLFEPYRMIMKNNGDIKNWYLPGFPEAAEVVELMRNLMELLGDEVKREGYKVCSKGHPYLVGECGKPKKSGKCATCGEKIGRGTDNVTWSNESREQGHFLDQAGYQPANPAPLRDMMEDSVSIIRLFTHMSLVWVAYNNITDLMSAIHPPIMDTDIADFLRDHISHDLHWLAKSISQPVDDAIVLVHLILKYMGSHTKIEHDVQADVLTNKETRRKWEPAFVNEFLEPIMERREVLIHAENARLARDSILSHFPDVTSGEVGNAYSCIWRVETTISISGLINSHKSKCKQTKLKSEPILNLFLSKVEELSDVKYIDSVLTLHKVVNSMYSRKLSVTEAEKTTISEFMHAVSPDMRPKMEACFREFKYIWNKLRNKIGSEIPTRFAGAGWHNNFEDLEIHHDSSIMVLLPTERRQGICSLALLYYLCHVQNKFLEEYNTIRGVQSESSIPTTEARRNHLISFTVDGDILPLLYSNCSYMMDVNADTELEYKFSALEEQIESKFIKSKSILQFKHDEFVFHDSSLSTNINIKKIQRRIQQNELDVVSQKKVTEVNDISLFNQLLSTLETAIGFLSIIGGDAEMKITSYITEVLAMSNIPLLDKIISCQLKHIKSLWLYLSHARARYMEIYLKLDPFEEVAQRYLATPDLDTVTRALEHVSLDSFLHQLFEAMLLSITIDQDAEEFEEQEEYILRDYMLEYQSTDDTSSHGMDHLPDDILVKHCVSVWKIATQKLHERN